MARREAWLRATLFVFATLVALHGWALYARHVLGMPLEAKPVFLFHFDLERNLPSLFATLLMLSASLLCGLRAREAAHDVGAWWLLTGCFAFLSVDEALVIHERFILPVRAAFDATGFFHYAWILPYGAAVVLLALALFGWWWRLPLALKPQATLAAVVFLSGAILVEGFSGWYLTRVSGGVMDLGYDVVTTLEEGLEFVGLLLWNRALLVLDWPLPSAERSDLWATAER